MITLRAQPGHAFRQVTTPFQFQGVTAVVIARPISAVTVTQEQVLDTDVLRYTAADAVSDYQLEVQSFGGAGSANPTFTSLTPLLAEVSESGRVTFKNPGNAQIQVTLRGETRVADLTMQALPGGYYDDLLQFTPGTVLAHAVHAVESRLAGKDPATTIEYFSSFNLETGEFTRNPLLWCNDIDLTCQLAWNHARQNHPVGTLVSPRHVLTVGHYMISIGNILRFVDSNGTYVDRTVTARLKHPQASDGKATDAALHLLNADVPETVGFARVLAPDSQSKLPMRLNAPRRLPFLYPDKFKTVAAAEIYRMLVGIPETTSIVNVRAVSCPEGPGFSRNKVMFDSGSPAFMIVNNTPVMLGMAYNWGGASITWLRDIHDDLNAMMTQLGGGYQLTPVDLSGFTTVV